MEDKARLEAMREAHELLEEMKGEVVEIELFNDALGSVFMTFEDTMTEKDLMTMTAQLKNVFITLGFGDKAIKATGIPVRMVDKDTKKPIPNKLKIAMKRQRTFENKEPMGGLGKKKTTEAEDLLED